MSSFEFVTVPVALIVGLGMAHLLTGLGRAVHFRRRASLWWVHLCWTASVFFYLAVHWWNLFYSNDGSTWRFLEYLYLLLHSALPYFSAVLLYRPDPEGAPDIRTTFEANRRWFFGVWALTLVADIPTTAIQGNLFNPWYYLPAMGSGFVLAVIGTYTSNLRYQQFLAVYFLAFILAWSVVVRGLLPPAA
jgi:hypothetical protein